MDNQEIERAGLAMMERYGCHTTILYGSRARGDATPRSDVDLLGVRQDGPSERFAKVVEGVYFDAFVYPESALTTLEPAMLRVLGGIVLSERNGFGTELLGRLRELSERGPAPLSADARQVLVLWSQKMLERFQGQVGIEADYRRMTLLVQALEDYFVLRNKWFQGSKVAFPWLFRNDVEVYKLFEGASQPGAGERAFSALVEAVYKV